MLARYERQMKKGILEILVLKLLGNEEKYGYQLICELKEESEEFFSLKEGTLYPILYRLEEEGLVVSEWSVPQGKSVSKKYYYITESGKQVLAEAIQLWQDFSQKVSRIMGGS